MRLFATFAIAALAMPAAALGDEMLLEDYGCYTCHAWDQAAMGPAFDEIAARYADDPAMIEELALRIREGSGGQWGSGMMPPHPQVSAADATAIVEYIFETAGD